MEGEQDGSGHSTLSEQRCALRPRTLTNFVASLNEKDSAVSKAGLFPTLDQLKLFESRSKCCKRVPFSSVIERFANAASVDDDLYFLSDLSEMIDVAKLLDDVDMEPRDRYTHCLAPVHTDNVVVASWFKHYALEFSKLMTGPRGGKFLERRHNRMVRLGFGSGISHPPRSPRQLSALEDVHAVTDLWLWLAHRFPRAYSEADILRAQKQQAATSNLVEQGLKEMTERGANARRPTPRVKSDRVRARNHHSSSKTRSRRGRSLNGAVR